MKLKYLVISDTHLGEDTSLLCFPRGRHHLWQELAKLFGDKVEVDTLVLLGDIPDRTLSSTAQITTQTNAFLQTLGSALDVRLVVYVPGNHDHTIWTAYEKEVHARPAGITSLAGDPVVVDGALLRTAPAVEELLAIFFGYPSGSAWRRILLETKHSLSIANPIYAEKFHGRTYMFAHGTHFRTDVTKPTWLKEAIDVSGLDKLLGGIEIDAGRSPWDATTLAEIEENVAPFVDSLWPSSGDKPTSKSDELWYLLTFISGKFGHHRPTPDESRMFRWEDLPATLEERIHRLLPSIDDDRSLEICRKKFLGLALDALRAAELPATDVTFVYGDTHHGGFQWLEEEKMRVYNTGGWVVHDGADHPPCHLFAVDEDGVEYLVDISFRGVEVGRKTLLEVASEDAENKKARASKLLKAVLSVFPRA